jgi:hypothetical protein
MSSASHAHEQAVLREERALQAAMLASDVDELDRLLHPELLAVGPDGRMMDKAGDLAAHRARVFNIGGVWRVLAAHISSADG